MLAYPGYTIKKIEDELSMRQVSLMMDFWQKEPPNFQKLNRIDAILQKGLGVRLVKSGGESQKADDTRLLAQVKGMGWL